VEVQKHCSAVSVPHLAASFLRQSKVGFVSQLSATHTASSLLVRGLLLNVGGEGRFLSLDLLDETTSSLSSSHLLKKKKKKKKEEEEQLASSSPEQPTQLQTGGQAGSQD